MQAAQNAALEAEIHHRDVILALARHFVGFFARALRHLVVHLKRFGQFEVGFRRFSLDDAAAQRAVNAHVLGQRAGIHAVKAGHALLVQILIERLFHLPVARHIAKLGDDKAAHFHARALVVDIVDAHVANERIGHADNLAAVGWIGQRFLIAGHAGRKDHLARHRGLMAE